MNENKRFPDEEYALNNIQPLNPETFNALVKRRFIDLFGYEPKDYNDWNENQDLRKDAEKIILEKINDTNNLLPISFLSKGVSKARAVCRITGFNKYGELDGIGTGFLIAPGVIMTNNHVIENTEQAKEYDAEFYYEENKEKIVVKLKPEEIFISSDSKELDFTIIACETKGIEDIEPVKLLRNPSTVTRYECVNIIQHPKGRKKEVALQDNKVIYIYDKVIRYITDTEDASSGSAVFNNSWELVALHHAGWKNEGETEKKYNEGIRISVIVDELIKRYHENINIRQQIEKILDTIEDTSPDLGYFDIQGLIDVNAVNIDISPDSFKYKKFIDIGFWNIEDLYQFGDSKKIIDISKIIGKLSMDIITILGAKQDYLEKIVDIMRKSGINMNYICLHPQSEKDSAIIFDLETTNIQVDDEISDKYEKIFNGKINFNNISFLRYSIKEEEESIEAIMIVIHYNNEEKYFLNMDNNDVLLTITSIVNDLIKNERLPVILMSNLKYKNNDILNTITNSTNMFEISRNETEDGMIIYISNKNYIPIQKIVISNDLKVCNINTINKVKSSVPMNKMIEKVTEYYPIATRLIYVDNYNKELNNNIQTKIKKSVNLNDEDLHTYGRLKAILNISKLNDSKEYYNEEEDKNFISEYYKSINFGALNQNELFSELHLLITKTHVNKFSYKESRQRYLYPWVDLREDGKLYSIYSNESMDPEKTILEDFETEKVYNQAYNNFIQDKSLLNDFSKHKTLKMLEQEYEFNCEHVVPQSWFDSAYPMKSDLHHLFTCEAKCNSYRSNNHYYDFIEYDPTNSLENAVKKCGMAKEKKFEPEASKGIVARATLYFLLRYPKILNEINEEYINLLLQWNDEFSVSLYEKHRNKAVFEAQGNRNPLIDFPEKASKIDFYTSLIHK